MRNGGVPDHPKSFWRVGGRGGGSVGPPRPPRPCCDVTGPGGALTSRSAPVPHDGDGPDSPHAAGAPRGFTSAPSGRLEQPGGLGQRPERRQGCGLNYAAKLRGRLSTHSPLFWGYFSPFWGPRRCLLPCGDSPVAARPACSDLSLTGGPFSSHDYFLLLFINYRNTPETTFWGRGG